MNNPTEGYIETPDEFEPQEDTVYCFQDAARVCSSDCVAYLTMRPEGEDYVNQPFSQCAVLVNQHRTGKHLTVLASQGRDLLKHFRIKAADAKRSANTPIAAPKVG